MTISVRLVLFPINRRSQTSMARYQKKMKRIQPQIDELVCRYLDGSASSLEVRQLDEAIQTDPRTLGYGFTTWSVARLTEHLRRRCRLRASPSTVRRVLAHEQFSLQRPKHTLEGKRDEKAHAKAKKELARLKKKRSARTQRKRSSSKTKVKSTRTRC